MAELSPAAAAMLQACDDRYGLAAALRKYVAHELVPGPDGDDCCIAAWMEIRTRLLAIAAELEAQ